MSQSPGNESAAVRDPERYAYEVAAPYMATRADELRVERELARIPYVTAVAASADARLVLVEGSRELPDWALERAIRLATEPTPEAPPELGVELPVETAPSAPRPTSAPPPRRAPSDRRAAPVATSSDATTEGSIRTVVPVLGMTCRSCEVRIERHVAKLPSVLRVDASAPRGRVVIESSRELSPRALAKAIGAAGYEIG